MLGVFRGEMAIFLPGRLWMLLVSDSVMVLGGIPGEFWVRTRPEEPHRKQEVVSRASLRAETQATKLQEERKASRAPSSVAQ